MDNIITLKSVRSKFPKRPQESNKSTFGKVLNIAGSDNYTGAAFFSSASCYKTGAGYVTLVSTKNVCDKISILAPEVTFYALKANENGNISSKNPFPKTEDYNTVSVGCGISVDEETGIYIFNLLKKIPASKIIFDADAINLISKYKGEIFLKNNVITPHPKELSRLLKVNTDEISKNREKYARIASQTYECITVLKGHNTIVTDGEKIYINETGNSALAKAGTGDVLTGVIAGLSAQGLSLFDAVISGVFIHGCAGDFASEKLTEYSVSATDVMNYIPNAIKYVISGEIQL